VALPGERAPAVATPCRAAARTEASIADAERAATGARHAVTKRSNSCLSFTNVSGTVVRARIRIKED
jgi:hypothetical protein